MTVTEKLRICVIDGYPEPYRKELTEAGLAQAHELYTDFLKSYVPNGIFDILFVADLHVSLPAGANLESYDAYMWTGSKLTIYHDDPRVTRQIELSRAIYEAGRPQCGTCWGVQMAAVAAGGEVKKNPKGREWSIARDIQLTEEGKKSPMYTGKPHRFDGFIMHLDEVTRIPEGGTLMATNAHTHVQALEVKHGKGTFWAWQYHPEYHLYAMARLLVARKEPLTQEGFFKVTSEVEKLVEKMTELSQHPDLVELQKEINIGPDVLDPKIRQQEFRNWIDYQVLPSLAR